MTPPIANVSAAGSPPIAAGDSAAMAAMPVLAPSPGDSGSAARLRIQQRIDAVIAGAAAGFGCHHVLAYRLNDETTQLHVASEWSSDADNTVGKARPLAGATADVAAMSGQAVVLEEPRMVADWPVPAWCKAAICLPISSDTKVVGSMWLLFDRPRTCVDAELGLMEIVAGRLALEFERLPNPEPTTLPVEAAKTSRDAQPSDQALMVPSHSPVLDELELAGWALQNVPQASFYDWHALPDGRMLIASATAADEANIQTGVWLQAARIALRSHAVNCRDAGELLTIANETLWSSSPGGQGVSLAVALLDSADATGSLALAGHAVALRWRSAGCDPIVAESPLAGWSETAVYLPRECSLFVRERLSLATLGTRPARIDKLCRQLESQSADAQRRMHARGALRNIVSASSDNGCDQRGVVLVRRR